MRRRPPRPTPTVDPRARRQVAGRRASGGSRPALTAIAVAPTGHRALGPRRRSTSLLAPGVGADRRVRPRADAADDLAVVPGLVDADRRSRPRRFVGLDNFRRHLRRDLGRPRLQGARSVNTALYTVLSIALILPLSVALGLLVHQRAVRRRQRAADRAVLDLHGADDRGGAGVVEALFADRRPAQPDARLGRHRAAALAVVARAPRWSRSCSSTSGSRSATSPCCGRRADADPGQRSTRPRRIDGANRAAALLSRSRCRCCAARCCSAP